MLDLEASLDSLSFLCLLTCSGSSFRIKGPSCWFTAKFCSSESLPGLSDIPCSFEVSLPQVSFSMESNSSAQASSPSFALSLLTLFNSSSLSFAVAAAFCSACLLNSSSSRLFLALSTAARISSCCFSLRFCHSFTTGSSDLGTDCP